MLHKRFIPLLLFALFFLGITYLADIGSFPTHLKSVPYYDSIGHFLLFGIYAFLAQCAFKGKKYFHIPLGTTLVTLYAIADELLQKLSPNRTFDISDLLCGLLGITVATILYYHTSDNRNKDNF